jgi:hypothetical protein
VEGLRHWPDHLESSAILEQANFRARGGDFGTIEKSIDGHAAIGSQTGTIIGIFRASGNAGCEGERLPAPFARPKKDRRYAAHRLRRSRQEGGPEQSPEPSSREHWFCVDQ